MKTIIAQSGQTIYDVAIQEYGDLEGVHFILVDNPELQLSQDIANVEMSIRSEVPQELNKNKANYFRSLGKAINSQST